MIDVRAEWICAGVFAERDTRTLRLKPFLQSTIWMETRSSLSTNTSRWGMIWRKREWVNGKLIVLIYEFICKSFTGVFSQEKWYMKIRLVWKAFMSYGSSWDCVNLQIRRLLDWSGFPAILYTDYAVRFEWLIYFNSTHKCNENILKLKIRHSEWSP